MLWVVIGHFEISLVVVPWSGFFKRVLWSSTQVQCTEWLVTYYPPQVSHTTIKPQAASHLTFNFPPKAIRFIDQTPNISDDSPPIIILRSFQALLCPLQAYHSDSSSQYSALKVP